MVLAFIIFVLNFILTAIETVINIILIPINIIIDIVNALANGVCSLINKLKSLLNIDVSFLGAQLVIPLGDSINTPNFCDNGSLIPNVQPIDFPELENPLKNFGLPLLLFTEDGCERCKCRDNDSDPSEEITPEGEGSDSELSDGNIVALLESLTDCTKAVNFKSNDNQGDANQYCYNNTNGFVTIDTPGSEGYPLCTTALSDAQTIIPDFLANAFGLNDPFKIFQYGRGCYNLVGKPVLSLFRDFSSVAEWSNRVKVNIAICNEVFDHTFSNAWINGTLFAFTFRNKVRFNALNQPVRKHCTELVIVNELTNNYYYRVTPYGNTYSQVYSSDPNSLNNGYFIGRPINTDAAMQIRGNEYQLMYPTTLINLGPKVSYLKELSYSNEFDGYIMSDLDSTSYGDNTEILNLFVLSRLTNLSMIKQIASVFGPIVGSAPSGFGVPPGVVSSDPIINLFFQNTRWGNGYNFIGLPGLIDGDYAQSIAINSEFGIEKFTSEDAVGAAVFFGEDELNPPKPVFGIFFEVNDQLRDYLSPRRKIWNSNGTTNPNNVYDYEQLPVTTQEVPFYSWRVEWGNSAYVFGTQNNRTLTSLENYDVSGYDVFPSHGYQSLDRMDTIGSKYPTPDTQLTEGKFYKGFITNYQADGSYKQYEPVGWTDNKTTVNMPFLFYFGLIKGSSAYDLFSQKYIGTDEL
jgi:hypothetical protein